MGLFSSIANIFGAKKVKQASFDAAAAQQAGLQKGVDAIGAANAANTARFDASQTGINDAIGGLQGYSQAGQDASGAIGGLLGLNGPEQQAMALAQLQNSPLFASLFGNGKEAVLQSASATGGLRGGDVNRSLADMGSDLFAQIIQQQLGNLGGVADRGAQAGTNILGARQNQGGQALNFGQLNAGAASGQAKLYAGQGDAKAGGILGAAKGSLMKYGAVADIGNQIQDALANVMTAGASGAVKGATNFGGNQVQFI